MGLSSREGHLMSADLAAAIQAVAGTLQAIAAIIALWLAYLSSVSWRDAYFHQKTDALKEDVILKSYSLFELINKARSGVRNIDSVEIDHPSDVDQSALQRAKYYGYSAHVIAKSGFKFEDYKALTLRAKLAYQNSVPRSMEELLSIAERVSMQSESYRDAAIGSKRDELTSPLFDSEEVEALLIQKRPN